MEKIVVLLSTYNGEKYIKEQIASIFQNKNFDIHILVRDDGSKDKTIDIIKSLHDKRIKVYLGKNIGPPMSFIDLICNADDADYYAFCDQDDVWNIDKFDNAVKKLRHVQGYGLYMSTYDVVDQKLNFIEKADMKFEYPYTLGRTIVHGCPSGCTMVFNKKLCKLLKKQRPAFIRMHDYWTLLVIEAMHGTIITDNNSQLLYRQHKNNTVGYGRNKIKLRIRRLIASLLLNKNERQRQAISVLECYKDILPDDSKKLLLFVYNYNNSLINKLKLLHKRELMPKEFIYKVLFISSVLIGAF